MLGYLEQTAATAIINALSSVGSLKPKFPFLDSTKSALIYVACHLKGMMGMITAACGDVYNTAQFDEYTLQLFMMPLFVCI